MRKRLTVVGGIVFALALGAPAAAQAAASTNGTEHAKAAAVPDAVVGCGTLYDYGNQKYAAIDGNNYLLYLEPLSSLGAAPSFCNVSNPYINGGFEIQDPNQAGFCIGAYYDQSDITWEAKDISCDPEDSHDIWTAYNTGQTYHSNTIWELQNYFMSGGANTPDGVCLYDDLQEPAVFDDCSKTSDHFMWFIWSGAGL
ncbi:MAG TPA: hypothetical protein VMG38_22250 [Trebonia sp.]|nr:hypothetical protein [Trebonia sp.]